MDINTLKIKKKNIENYITGIAGIHKDAYSRRHLTAYFNLQKTEDYYRCLIKAADLCVIAMRNMDGKENGQVVGFIVSGENVSRGISNFKSRNRLYLISVLLRHPRFVFEIAFRKIASIFPISTKTKAQFRLASMGVLQEMQSIGVGKKMLDYFEGKIAKRGYKLYGLSVRKSNQRAIDFYLNNGFTKEFSKRSVLQMVKEI